MIVIAERIATEIYFTIRLVTVNIQNSSQNILIRDLIYTERIIQIDQFFPDVSGARLPLRPGFRRPSVFRVI